MNMAWFRRMLSIFGMAGAGDAVAVVGDVTISNGAVLLNAALKEQVVAAPIKGPGAGNIPDFPVFVLPRANILQSIGILTKGAAADVSDTQTVVITLKDDAGNTIVTKTYNTGTQPPDTDYEDLGALSEHKALAAGEHVSMTLAQGVMCDMSAFDLIFVTVPTNA